MRKLHRWSGLITGFFFMIMSLTGIGMETVKLLVPDEPRPSETSAAIQTPGERPPPKAAGRPRSMDLYHLLNHIHDGELAGPAGRIFVLILGFALFFFSVSGLWMYWKMYDGRSRAGNKQVIW